MDVFLCCVYCGSQNFGVLREEITKNHTKHELMRLRAIVDGKFNREENYMD